MRCFLIVAAATLMVSGCTIAPGNGATTSGSGGADAGPSVCDGKKDCNACAMCSAQSICSAQITTCSGDSECLGINECVQANCMVGDANCIQSCEASDPDGVANYNALQSCKFCTACPSDCAGYMTCS